MRFIPIHCACDTYFRQEICIYVFLSPFPLLPQSRYTFHQQTCRHDIYVNEACEAAAAHDAAVMGLSQPSCAACVPNTASVMDPWERNCFITPAQGRRGIVILINVCRP